MDAIADWTARERPDDAPATTAVTRLLRAAAHLEPELEETLAEHRLSRPSFEVLAALHEAPNQSLTQRQVMTATRRTSGTMSVRIARLARARYVNREPDPDDRRGVIISLTERGRRAVEAALPAYAEAARRLTLALDDGQRDTLTHSLDTWLGFFEEAPAGERSGPRLGVAVAPAHVAQRMRRAVGLPERVGVLVRGVKPGGPGAVAGLAEGDLITAAAGEEVRTIGDLLRAVSRTAEGERLKLDLVRGVEERSVEVALV
jgi:DNA-binding MarR family transcriptional regulator